MAMYYTSEMIEKILESSSAREVLGWLPPVYEKAYVFLWLLETIGQQLDDMERWSREFQDQVVPQTSTWSLPYWEERYGLPSNPDLPLERRRANVIMKMYDRTPMNPTKLAELVTKITGVPTSVEENIGKNRFAVRCLGYVDDMTIKQAMEKIDEVKPSHLVYEINVAIQRKAEHVLYTAVVSQTRKIHEIEVI